MGRRIYFDRIGETDWRNKFEMNFGLFCAVLYYSSKHNESNGEKLFYASITESDYRAYKGLSNNEVVTFGHDAHYSYSDLPPVINYLQNELIPALNNEGDILLYSESTFKNLFDNMTNYIDEFNLGQSDVVDYYSSDLTSAATALLTFFQRVKDNESRYEVWVE